LTVSIVAGLITHGWRLLGYPLFITDEGIYVQQAWSVVREGRLSPYTYYYDHAPAGWLVMAGWAAALPSQFQTFGNEVATIRVLMLLTHLVSAGLLFEIVRSFSGSAAGAFLAAFAFNFSPIAIYYGRQVLLDNLMVFWLLLAVYLLTRPEGRVFTPVLSGFAFGLAMVTKENAVFFAPALAYLLYRRAQGLSGRRFMTGLWWLTLAAPVSAYALFSLLKTEFLPTGLNFDLNNPPADHVSLLYTVWWQANRSGPEGRAAFLNLLEHSWLMKDRYLLIGGSVAVLATLWLWSRDRAGRPGYLAAALLAIGYGFYLARGSELLDFYVTPMIPVLAMNVGILFGHLTTQWRPAVTATGTSCLLAAALLVPGAYLLQHDVEGRLQFRDAYHLNLTSMQEQQIAYVRKNIPPDARIVIDDDIWTALHDREPYYARAHSHFKASSDPDVRDRLFRSDWQNVDYIVMSNKMRVAMDRNNGDGREDWIIEALEHGKVVWQLEQGDIQLAIYQIEK
jgi:4-amino-4-deoxy-L-arabinose transferase-like glycosyltransferase